MLLLFGDELLTISKHIRLMEKSLTQKMLDLVADDRFERIEALATRPNLFRIVGRTFTETWHSMFLGWLMDPKGSHRHKTPPHNRHRPTPH